MLQVVGAVVALAVFLAGAGFYMRRRRYHVALSDDFGPALG